MVLLKYQALLVIFLLSVSTMTLTLQSHQGLASSPQVHEALTSPQEAHEAQDHEGPSTQGETHEATVVDVTSTTNYSEANNTVQTHQLIQNHENLVKAFELIITGIDLAIKFFQAITKPLNCPNGYMRTNYLTVTNNLKGRLISFENNYFDSGHMFSPAPLFGSVIYPGKSQMYETVKTAHAATGANVMFNFAVSGSSQKISILIENPWSGWPLVGVCYGRFSTANKANYYNIYNRVYQLAAATGYRRTVNAYNDGNCFYIENIYSKSSNLNVKHIYTIGGLTFGVEWIYEYLKAINGGSCYTTKMVVVVA